MIGDTTTPTPGDTLLTLTLSDGKIAKPLLSILYDGTYAKSGVFVIEFSGGPRVMHDGALTYAECNELLVFLKIRVEEALSAINRFEPKESK